MSEWLKEVNTVMSLGGEGGGMLSTARSPCGVS